MSILQKHFDRKQEIKNEVNIGNHDFLHKKVDDMTGIDLNSN